MRLLWPTHSAAVVVMRPVTEAGLGRAVSAFSALVGRQPRTIALSFKGAEQLLRGAVDLHKERKYLVDGEDVAPMTIFFKHTRRPIRVLPSALLPVGWVLLKR